MKFTKISLMNILDIENLGKKIIKQVQEKFGITLEWEIKIIGT